MRNYLSIFVLCLCILLPLASARCQEDEKIYDRATEYVKSGDTNSAFMSLHALVTAYPASGHARDSLFSLGEYYYRVNDLRDAQANFFRMVKQYPDSPAAIFCYAYLLDISKKEKKDGQAKAFERLLIDSQRLIFLFSESKQFTYTSVFGVTYKAVYYIDKVEIYADGTLFTSVSY
jgi:outer membrane protein assembly factor BamD (BamD/ComL family)